MASPGAIMDLGPLDPSGVGGLAQLMGGGSPADSGLPSWMQGGGLAALLGGVRGGGGSAGDGGKGLMGLGQSMLNTPQPGAAPGGNPAAGGAPKGDMGASGMQSLLALLGQQGGAQQFPLLPKGMLGGMV